ncbi:hypothetical protein [Mesorhizobium sp. B1-1-5]|uniref:hypothetical protein n=1 Tax=Mesorhizobium sp. B1-1-5 TaxID=2589979 RepID=UPI00112C488B|nr:hypothetical protein [Mesorhizobium sp. B1-1-5]TPO05172.1 hypothetical protein FJ980_14975 [Mesorhizobium sp. B1-1-5]
MNIAMQPSMAGQISNEFPIHDRFGSVFHFLGGVGRNPAEISSGLWYLLNHHLTSRCDRPRPATSKLDGRVKREPELAIHEEMNPGRAVGRGDYQVRVVVRIPFEKHSTFHSTVRLKPIPAEIKAINARRPAYQGVFKGQAP